MIDQLISEVIWQSYLTYIWNEKESGEALSINVLTTSKINLGTNGGKELMSKEMKSNS